MLVSATWWSRHLPNRAVPGKEEVVSMLNGESGGPALTVLTRRHSVRGTLCLSRWVLSVRVICFCSMELHGSSVVCLWRELFAVAWARGRASKGIPLCLIEWKWLGLGSHLFCFSCFVFHELICSIVYSSVISSCSRKVKKIRWLFWAVKFSTGFGDIPKNLTQMGNCWALLSIASSCCWVQERSGSYWSWLQSLRSFGLCPSYVCKH